MKPGYKSRIDKLLDSLGEPQRSELLDLLSGEPLLSHSSVAAVINDVFGKIEGHTVLDRNVMDWRRAKGVRFSRSSEGLDDSTNEQSS